MLRVVAHDMRPRFVGRDVEMARLWAAFESVQAEATAAVFVGGEGGIGKTRLLSEFAARVGRDAGATVLSGACIDISGGPPFWPIVDALRRLLRGPDAVWARQVLGPWLVPLAETFPAMDITVEAAARPGRPDPLRPHSGGRPALSAVSAPPEPAPGPAGTEAADAETAGAETAGSEPVPVPGPRLVGLPGPGGRPGSGGQPGSGGPPVGSSRDWWTSDPFTGLAHRPPLELLFGILVELARRRPLVLVIEDLHWADRSTRELITYLLASFSDAPVLICASYRTEMLAADSPLRPVLTELWRGGRVQRFELTALSREHVAELVEATAGAMPDAGFGGGARAAALEPA
jgi:hypothetical protein